MPPSCPHGRGLEELQVLSPARRGTLRGRAPEGTPGTAALGALRWGRLGRLSVYGHLEFIDHLVSYFRAVVFGQLLLSEAQLARDRSVTLSDIVYA